MTKQKVLMVCLFLVALGCGFVAGRNFGRPEHEGRREPSWLADELKLTSAQREQMRTIWSETLKGEGQRHGDRRRQLQRERDEAVVALLTAEQRTAYDKVQERFGQQMAEISKEREASFQRAVEQTKAILNESQRAKYEQLMKSRAGGPPWGRGPGSAPTSGPGPAGPPPEPGVGPDAGPGPGPAPVAPPNEK